MLQLDPVSAVAPSADLVAWSRLGSAYEPEHLQGAVADRDLIELLAFLRPAEDMALYRGGDGRVAGQRRAARSGRSSDASGWRPTTTAAGTSSPGCARTGRCRPGSCPTPATSRGSRPAGPTTRTSPSCSISWSARGEVAVAGRKGRERLWDLAERVYPDHPVIPAAEAARERDRRRLRALGIARVTGPAQSFEPVRRRSGRRAGRGRGRPRPVARRPGLSRRPGRAGRAVRRPGGAAVPVRPPRARPGPRGRHLRVRVPA